MKVTKLDHDPKIGAENQCQFLTCVSHRHWTNIFSSTGTDWNGVASQTTILYKSLASNSVNFLDNVSLP